MDSVDPLRTNPCDFATHFRDARPLRGASVLCGTVCAICWRRASWMTTARKITFISQKSPRLLREELFLSTQEHSTHTHRHNHFTPTKKTDVERTFVFHHIRSSLSPRCPLSSPSGRAGRTARSGTRKEKRFVDSGMYVFLGLFRAGRGFLFLRVFFSLWFS